MRWTASRCATPSRSSTRYWDYDVPMLAGDFVTDDAGTGFVHMAPSHGADDYELFVKNGLVDRMTHNVLEDSSFAPHVPFFAGLQVFDAKGKEGKANKAVIDKLIEAGRAARPRPDDPQLPPLLALQGPGHLPQHAAVVRRHRQAARRRHGHLRRHHPRARPHLHRPARPLVPADRPQPPLLDDRGPPRLGPLPPARLGRAAHLLRETPPRRHGGNPPRPGGQRPHQGGLRARGRRRLVRGERQGPLPRQRPPRTRTGRRSPTSSTSGSTQAPPTPSRCATAPTASGPRRSTSKAPTSTAAGSTPRCCRPAAPAAAPPTTRW